MDPKVSELLERDLEAAIESRDKIYHFNNYEVTKLTYKNPPIRQLVLPLGHPHGLLVHYQKIIDLLEGVKENGEISEDPLPLGSPGWLEDLLEGLTH